MKRKRSIEGTVQVEKRMVWLDREIDSEDAIRWAGEGPPAGARVTVTIDRAPATLTWEEDVLPHTCDDMWPGWEWQWGTSIGFDGEKQLLCEGSSQIDFPYCPFCGEKLETGGDS